MIRHGVALTALALAALAVAGWTYSVNYDTRAALDRISGLRGKIADARETLQVLRVEWAWLNRPDRLARLVARYDDRLALVPLTPAAFGSVAEVPFRPDAPAEPAPVASSDVLIGRASPAQGAVHGGSGQSATPPAATRLASLGGKPAGTETRAPAGPRPATRQADSAVEAAAPGEAQPAPTRRTDKAEEAGEAAPQGSTTMREAVALALIEAGVVQPGDAGAETESSASAAPSSRRQIPMPKARPSVQVYR